MAQQLARMKCPEGHIVEEWKGPRSFSPTNSPNCSMAFCPICRQNFFGTWQLAADRTRLRISPRPHNWAPRPAWEYRIGVMAAEAKREIKAMAEDARASIDDILGFAPPF